MTKRRAASAVLSLVATASLTGLLTAAPASAAPYDPYTGSNPYTTGCAADATTIATRPIKSQQATFGTMEVRYSPSCGTNRVRAVMANSFSGYTVVKGLIRASSQLDGHGGWLGYYENYERDAVAGSPFGMQVYAPRSTRIRVMNRVDDASGQTVAFTGSDFPYNRWIDLC
jgi:hypothetical protein